MAQQCSSVLIQFGCVEQSAGDDLVANGIDQRDEMGAAVIAELGGGDGHFDLDNLNARSPQQGRQTPADEAITPAGVEHGMEGVQQKIPRRMRRLTEPGYIVHVREDQRSAGPQQREHFRHEGLAGRHIDQDKPLVHEIIRVFLKTGVQRVCLHHPHVPQPAFGDFGTRHLHEAGLSFKSHDRSGLANTLRQ